MEYIDRFARARLYRRGKEVSSASTLCLDASVGPALPVRRRLTSFSMSCWRYLIKKTGLCLFGRRNTGQAWTKSERTGLVS